MKCKIAVLCGSRSYKDEMYKVEQYFINNGMLVFLPDLYGTFHKHFPTPLNDQMRENQFAKIRLADLVVIVFKPDGTIGEATRENLEFAKSIDKKIKIVNEFKKTEMGRIF